MDHQDTTQPVQPPASPAVAGASTPRDFFLWLGAVIALYASVTAVLMLIFQYVDLVYPDPLYGYSDPYMGPIRFGMATLIVMVPTAVVLLRTIRKSITEDAAKAGIRIRRWAIALTLFLAAATIAIDLITVINTFLSGELTSRFVMKAGSVLLVAGAIFLHFLADSAGYWVANPRKANAVGAGFIIAAVAAILAGFAIAGTPSEMRAARLDQQRVDALRDMQYQVVNYWQTREELPESLTELNDPISGYSLPTDPETGAPYEYAKTGRLTFELCATFAAASRDNGPREYSMAMGTEGSFSHEAGRTCFARIIDPQAYPPFPKSR